MFVIVVIFPPMFLVMCAINTKLISAGADLRSLPLKSLSASHPQLSLTHTGRLSHTTTPSLTCSSGRRSRSSHCPACCRSCRPCRHCSGSLDTGAGGWAGRWRARSSGCSSGGWSNPAVTAAGTDCPLRPAPASAHWWEEGQKCV